MGLDFTPRSWADIFVHNGTNAQDFSRFEGLIHNALLSRDALWRKFLDPRRDISAECGYPPQGSYIAAQEYQLLYDREDIAARVVEVLPKESWQVQPSVYESEDPEVTTPFERGWDQLSQQLRGDSLYQDEEGSLIWEWLCRVDQISGIGHYGVLFLGLDESERSPEDEQELLGPVDEQEQQQQEDQQDEQEGVEVSKVGKQWQAKKDKQRIQLDQQQAKVQQAQPGAKNGQNAAIQQGGNRSQAPQAPNGKVQQGVQQPDKGAATSDEELAQQQQNAIDSEDGKYFPQSVVGKQDQYVVGKDVKETPKLGKGSGAKPPLKWSKGMDLDEQGNPRIKLKGPTGQGGVGTGGGGSGTAGGQGQWGDYLSATDLSRPVVKASKLVYLRCFSEAMAPISAWDNNPLSPRYGQPTHYLITFNDPQNEPAQGLGYSQTTRQVHWTRIIHIADNLNTSEIFGIPRMQQVFNRLLDLRKLQSGSAEMYWRGAFPGLALSTHPQLGGDVKIDMSSVKDYMEQYMNGLQRYLMLMGMSAQTLAPTVVDPTSQIEVQINAICIKLGIPVRIFKGSERGELASSQDDAAWNDRLKFRQKYYISPRVIAPFVDRLIRLGVLPTPDGFSIDWPDLTSQSKQEKAQVAQAYTAAMAQYVSGGLNALITEEDYLVMFLGLDEEEARNIVMRAACAQEDQQQIEQNQQQHLIDQGLIPDPTQPQVIQSPDGKEFMAQQPPPNQKSPFGQSFTAQPGKMPFGRTGAAATGGKGGGGMAGGNGKPKGQVPPQFRK